MNKKEIAQQSTEIYIHLVNIFKEDKSEVDDVYVDFDTVDETFFTSSVSALMFLYQKMTGDTTDLLGFTHILNRLAVQSLIESEDKQ